MTMTRRSFLHTALATSTSGLILPGLVRAADTAPPLFKISLAQWSLHNAFFKNTLDPMNFAIIAKKDFGIEGIEYVNQFYKNKGEDKATLQELKKKADDNGVTSLLIMCDGEGKLGNREKEGRKKTVENHYKWVNAAKFLGCHSIRVNAQSDGTYEEQLDLAADGLSQLTEYAAKVEINVIVENHGGLSSNGEWLAAVMKKVNNPRCGTLPDFGNFNLGGGKTYDRYKGVAELMPFAKGVSAKSHDFDEMGNETHTDYVKMMKIVLDAGYRGWVGIEYEGRMKPEPEGIQLTKKLLEKVRAQLSKK